MKNNKNAGLFAEPDETARRQKYLSDFIVYLSKITLNNLKCATPEEIVNEYFEEQNKMASEEIEKGKQSLHLN